VGGYGTYAFTLSQLGWGLVENGKIEEAMPFLDRSAEVAAFTEDLWATINVGAARHFVDWIWDDRDAHIAGLRDIGAHLQEPDAGGLAHSMLFVGQEQLLGHLGDWRGALESLNVGLGAATRFVSLMLGQQLLAVIAHTKLGEREQAETVLEAIRKQYERNAALRLDFPLALLRWAEAHRLLYGVAAREEVETSCDQLIEAAQKHGFLTYEPFARVERAELATLLGDDAGRKRELVEAARLFREIGAFRRAEAIERS
jgi:hypothetical protein